MRVALVLALAAVALREPDAPVGDTVDGADVDAVGADHFHVLGDLVRGHLVSPYGFAECAGAARPPASGGRELPTRVRRRRRGHLANILRHTCSHAAPAAETAIA